MTKRAKQSVGREFKRTIDANVAEQAERGVALRRKNHLFAGRVPRVERAAALYSLIGTAKLKGYRFGKPAYAMCSNASLTNISSASRSSFLGR